MGHYGPGLRYVLLLNAMGIGPLIRAWQSDLYLLRGTAIVPRFFLAAIGILLQLPGVQYLGVGWWSLSEMGAVLPGTEPPPPAP